MVTHSRHRIHFAVSAILSLSLVLLFCGKDSLFNKPEPQEYGNVAPVLLFKKGARTLATVPQGVKDIRLRIMRGTAVDTSLTVPYSAHQAEIDHIPVGDVLLTVDGLDSLGQAMDTGSVLVSIAANVIAQPVVNLISTHPIVLIFTSPRNNDTLASKSVTLSGSIVAEYGLLTFTMGQSGVSVDGDQWSRNADLADGINQFVFVAVDNKGNFLRDTLTVFYSATAHDLTGPVITLVQPADSSTVPLTPITITGTATDPSGILAVQVNTKTATLSGSSFSISQDLVPGPNKIIVTAIDNSPTQNKSSDTFFVTLNTASKDTIGPSVTINTPKDGDTVASATVMISGTASDISGLASVTVNGAVATITNSVWSASIPVTAGPNKIVVIATDASPQHNVARDTITIVYNATAQDKTLPSVAITSPSNNTVVSNPLNIAIAGTASDPAGIASVKVNGLSAVYASGSWSASVTLSHAGNNAVWAVATDNAGNRDSTSVNLIYDSTAADVIPPSIILVSHTKGQTVSVSPVLIQVTATDANGINWVTINGDTAALNAGKYEKSIPLVNGVNQIKVVAQDKSTNRNVDSLKFTLTYDPSATDTIPPKITLSTLTPGQVVSSRNVLVQVTATDANGIAWVTIRGDTAALDAGRYEKTEALANGVNTIKVVAQDASSNRNIDSLVFTLMCDTTAADNAPPQITLLSPTSGTRVGSSPQLIVVNVTDQSGVASVAIAGRAASFVNADYQAQIDLVPGSNSITISAEDASANKNKGQITINLVYDTTLNAKPQQPVLSTPQNQAVSQPVSISLAWNSAAYAVTYRVQVATSSDFSALTVDDSTLTTTSRSVAGLANGTTYYWRVLAKNANGLSTWSAAWSFTTAFVAPPAPVLVSPPNSATGQPFSLRLGWNSVPQVQTYWVQVAGDAGFSTITLTDSTLTDTLKTLSGLTAGATYYWRVKAKNPSGWGSWSSAFSFAVSHTPYIPVLVSPANQSKNQTMPLTLKWNQAAGAKVYYINVWSTTAGQNFTRVDSTVNPADTQYTLSGLMGSIDFQWTVRAKNADSMSAWATAWTFSTGSIMPPVPTLKSPANGATHTTLPTMLSWNAAAGALSYHVQVSTSASFTSNDSDYSAVPGTTLVLRNLSVNTTYYWRVYATNGDSSTAWSSAWNFTTIVPPPVPTLKSPANGAVIQASAPTLTWLRPDPSVTGYSVNVSTHSDFSVLDINYTPWVTAESLTLSSLGTIPTYYWRVQADNADGASAWSAPDSFSVTPLVWGSVTPAGITFQSIAQSGNLVFAGTQGNGLYVSRDTGATWAAVGGPMATRSVLSVFINGTTVFAGTDGAGVYRSTDGGNTWVAADSGFQYTYPLATDFVATGASVLAGWTVQGVYRTSDNGVTWTASNSGLTNLNIYAFTKAGSTIFADAGNGVFISNDGGNTWSPTSLAEGGSFAVDGTSIYTVSSYSDKIFMSGNNGTTWTTITDANTAGFGATPNSIAVSGGRLFAGTLGAGIFVSSDNGTTWSQANYGLTGLNVPTLKVIGTRLYAGTSNGLFRAPLQ